MSHILFTSDNLTLTWDASISPVNHLWETCTNSYLTLWVSILVNWKLKTFNLQFQVDKSEKFWLAWDYYTFTNWYEWDTFQKTIESLGYSFWEFSIKKSIEQLTWEQSIEIQK